MFEVDIAVSKNNKSDTKLKSLNLRGAELYPGTTRIMVNHFEGATTIQTTSGPMMEILAELEERDEFSLSGVSLMPEEGETRDVTRDEVTNQYNDEPVIDVAGEVSIDTLQTLVDEYDFPIDERSPDTLE